MTGQALDEGFERSPELIIGREAELGRLSRLLDAVPEGSSSLVITGVAGQGKSRLLHAAIDEAKARGFVVGRARGVEFARGLPFAALAAVLGPLHEWIDALPDAQSEALTAALGIADSTAPLRLTYQALMSLLEAAGKDRPVLLVLDDGQWVDEASLAALLYAAHRSDVERVGFLFGVRTGTAPQLERARLPGLELSGLSDEASIDILVGLDVAPRVAATYCARAQGNPLALILGAEGLSPEQRIGDAPLPPVVHLPERLVEMFSEELTPLPPRTFEALCVAALEVGDELRLLAPVLRQLDLSLGELAAAEDRRTIVIAGGRVVWFHPLVRAAVVRRISPRRRRVFQRALADATEAAGLHERAVWHLVESAAGPDPEIAAWLVDVAEKAAGRGARGAAGTMYLQAADLVEDRITHDRHLAAAATLWWGAGDYERSATLVRSRIGEITDLAIRGQMALILGQAEMWVSGPAAATGLLTQHAATVEHQAPDVAAFLLLHAVTARLLAVDVAGATRLADRAAVLAETSGDAGAQLGTWAISQILDLFGGAGASAEDQLATIEQIAVAGLHQEVEGADTLVQLCGYGHLLSERWSEAEQLFGMAIRSSQGSGMPGRSVVAGVLLADTLWRTGRWDESLAHLSQLLSMQEATGLHSLLPCSQAVLARVEAGYGHESACRAHAAEALRIASQLGMDQIRAWALSSLGLLDLGARRYEQAAAHFTDLEAIAGHITEPGWLWWQADAAEALARCGRRSEAIDRLER